jgi:APA family basic amino acid/polyamine antiporter
MSEMSFLGLHFLDNLGIKFIAIALIIFLTYFNTKGLKLGEKLSNTLVTLMIIVMVGIIILGLTSSVGNWEYLKLNSVKFNPEEMQGGTLFKALALACLSAFWGYEGWNSVGYIGGEIKNPQRNLPWH